MIRKPLRKILLGIRNLLKVVKMASSRIKAVVGMLEKLPVEILHLGGVRSARKLVQVT